ncbi:sensor histidine kinase [Cryptosporangium arvum]|uniref:sensor histidine kinase n=1 Tax=Cryptosporangium arvum TaxID=80871 RepID=UPI0012EE6D06|nr:ATP-binding protein [Cryptosporangium arvum]
MTVDLLPLAVFYADADRAGVRGNVAYEALRTPELDAVVRSVGPGAERVVRIGGVTYLVRAGAELGVVVDVSGVVASEHEAAHAARLESIGALAAGLAHEINTPVQYVSHNVVFLREAFESVLPAVSDEYLRVEVPAALEQTLEGVERVAGIVRAMNEFAHPGEGLTQADLNRAVESTVAVCRNEWKYVARLGLELDPSVGLVACYEGELKQVVLNLVVNAAHAVAATGSTGVITVATRGRPDAVEISVSDSGVGMDEETRLRVFDPFFTTKGVGRGTGQGLAMAWRCVVGTHGGSIEVVSAPGEGSTFRVVLPRLHP